MVGIPVMVLIAGAAVWLLLGFGVERDRLDAIRTGSALGVGLGGVVVLWLGVRRQRSTELDLLQKYEAHRLAERIAAHNEKVAERTATHSERDATARRITELYGKGVDQLGSDKAPVRLGGLYALERLAQDNPDPQLRQTIVNVICAYLRMPYTRPPLTVEPAPRPLGQRRRIRPGYPPPLFPGPPASPTSATAATFRQEGEVRLTAQNILAAHLQSDADRDHPGETFWAGISLDLTGATLVNLNLSKCHINGARFNDAEFLGPVQFTGTKFDSDAWFVRAKFDRDAWFGNARFARHAMFNDAEFVGAISFIDAEFDGPEFDGAEFDGAKFTADARFDRVRFGEHARFDHAEFIGPVWFTGAKFDGDAWFGRAKFAGDVRFEQMEFTGDVAFTGAEFERAVPPEVARFISSGEGDRRNDDGEP